MNVNNLTTLIISLMVCGLVVGATIPMITAISNETIVEEYNSTDDASWIRMAYGTSDYDLEYTLADDTITVGTQSGTADDMILYADEKSCIMSVDGEFVIVNGYIENPEVIKADTVTVTKSAETITITDGTDTIISTNAPAWAYYPKADGTYSFFDASVEGVKVKPTENLASAGAFAGVMAYNNFVVAPNGYGDLGMTQDAVITDNVIDSITWAVGVVADDLSLTSFEPGSITIQPLNPSIIDEPVTSGGVGLMAINPGQYNDGTFTFNVTSGTYVNIMSYVGPVTSNLVIPSTITYNGVDYTVLGVNQCVSNSSLNDGATLTISEGIRIINDYAFSGCSKFSGDLVIPSSVTTINQNAFAGCSGFTTLKLNNGLATIGNNAFLNCSFTSTLVLPDTLTSLGIGAFESSNFSGTLVIPSNISNIRNSTFTDTDFSGLIVLGSPTLTVSDYPPFSESMKEVLNLGETEITTTSYGLDADDVRDDVPALGYIAPLSNTVIVQKEGAIFDVLSLLPLVAGIGLLMIAVIYALERRYI